MHFLKNKETAKHSPFLLTRMSSYKHMILLFLMATLIVITAFDAEAALFSQLTESGSKIFEGMKTVIYAVAGFGIIGIAIGGFFGNLNWKWLSAIIIGLLVTP